MKKLLLAILLSTTTATFADTDSDMMWANNCEFHMHGGFGESNPQYDGMTIQEVALYIDENMLWADDAEFQIVTNILKGEK